MNDFHIVEGPPTSTVYDTMVVTDNMEVLREVTNNEILLMANKGYVNHGNFNVGSFNQVSSMSVGVSTRMQ